MATNENKRLCPFNRETECTGYKCVWWDVANNECEITTISAELEGIRVALESIVDLLRGIRGR